ncbi:MAG: DUF2799 domain-containing protein [Pseudomonadota bacterium]
MYRPIRLATISVALVAAVTVSGCASMSAEECMVSDWQTVGFEDGTQGVAESRIGTYRKACATAGVVPDLAAYRAGHAEGLRVYCRPQNGYAIGERGGHYGGVCPTALEGPFLSAYDDGRTLFTLRQDVTRLEERLADARDELVAVEARIERETLRMIGAGLSPEERLQILGGTKSLAERKEALEDEIALLADELVTSRERLENYELRIAAR